MIIHLNQLLNVNLAVQPISENGVVYNNLSGFLSILQTQLGLAYSDISYTKRIIQYLHCLQQKDIKNRFYHQSFLVDELGVTKKLLAWRDELYLAGWKGKIAVGASKRLKDLADVEKLAFQEVSPNEGQQIEGILQRLKSYKTQLKQIYLHDDKELLPSQWQTVLEQLEIQGVDILSTQINTSHGKTNTDLEWLQKSLAENKPVKLKGDGSVLIIKSQSKTNSAQMIGQYLSTKKQYDNFVILAEQDQKYLEQQLVQYNLPKSDFHQSSPARSILQLLPLSIQLIWDPIDLNKVLSFLQHSISILPRFSREILAETIASYPGVGGKHWDDAIADIRDIAQSDRIKYTKKETDELINKINYWLCSELYDPKIGVPLELLIEKTKIISLYLQGHCQYLSQILSNDSSTLEPLNSDEKNLKEADRRLSYQAVEHCVELTELLQLLTTQGNDNISQLKLKQIMDMVIGSGTPLPLDRKQANAPIITDNSTLIFQPVEELFWWNMSLSQSVHRIPWTQVEMDFLAAYDIKFPYIAEQLVAQEQSDVKAIKMTKNRLVVILHDGEENHPLWDKINILTQGFNTLSLEQELQNTQSKIISGLKIKKLTQNHNSLPAKKRWWLLEDGKQLSKRKVESYSSLDAFINSPYQWVLNYKARLKAGNLQSISEGNMLKGSFTHELFECFFNHYDKSWQKISNVNIQKWFNKKFDQMIKEQAVVFLAPGKISEQEEFRETVFRALTKLIVYLKSAKVKKIIMEQDNEVKFFAGQIFGSIDMLLINDKAEEIILDLKWGSENYKAEELQNNLHTQLAIYSYMRKSQTNAQLWPEQAYFIINSANLLAQNNFTFPDALVHEPEEGESAATLWKKLEASYKWRRKQLNQGEIEMTIKGTEADDDSIPPDNALTIEETNDHFNNFKNLMGWEK